VGGSAPGKRGRTPEPAHQIAGEMRCHRRRGGREKQNPKQGGYAPTLAHVQGAKAKRKKIEYGKTSAGGWGGSASTHVASKICKREAGGVTSIESRAEGRDPKRKPTGNADEEGTRHARGRKKTAME